MNNLLLFTYLISLKKWDELGLLSREISLYKKLEDRAINYAFITYGDKRELKYSNVLGNIEIIPVKSYLRTSIPFFHFLQSFLLPIKLRRRLQKFQIVKTNQIYGSWITWPLKYIYKKKILIRCGVESLKNALFELKSFGINLNRIIKIIFLFLIELISYNIADKIIVTSNYDRDFIRKIFKIRSKKIVNNPNFIDTNLFKPLDLKKKENSILYIGRLNPIKNLKNLILSFKQLPNYSLTLIGSGNYEKELIHLVKSHNLSNRIEFLGRYPNYKLAEIINQYPVFILPSIYEGNPKALLEAMSCGVACIGSKTPGIEEIISDLDNGLLCNHDSKSIAKTIRKILEDDNLRLKIEKNARNFIIEKFSLESVIDKEISIYKKI